MNTIMVVMVLAGRLWTPSYVVVYESEKQCQEAAVKVTQARGDTQKGICVPQVFVR